MSDINTVITDEDLRAYLGIDYADDMVERNIERAINTADGELRESVGDDYPVDHPLTKELALIYASVSYENRELSGNEGKRAKDIALKLRLRLRRGSNE
jgi:hypothetical protein